MADQTTGNAASDAPGTALTEVPDASGLTSSPPVLSAGVIPTSGNNGCENPDSFPTVPIDAGAISPAKPQTTSGVSQSAAPATQSLSSSSGLIPS